MFDTTFPVLFQALPVPVVAPEAGKSAPVDVDACKQVEDTFIGVLAAPWQMTAPAATGTGKIVNVLFDVALLQEPLPLTVKVRVTLPAAISPALGVYIAKVKESASVKVPVPLEDQSTPSVFVAEAPVVMSTAPELAHVEIAVPATAVGKAKTLTVYVAVAAVHVPLETVIVKVTSFPASPAAAVYVGVNVPCPAVMDPAPFSVQTIVPLDDEAPLT